MKAQITAVWMALAVATVAGQQSSQTDQSTTAAGSTVSRPESSTVRRPESTREATPQPGAPAPLQLPPIARPDPAQAGSPQANAQPRCPGNSSTVAGGSASSSFPGVSASQLPRAEIGRASGRERVEVGVGAGVVIRYE